MLYRVKIRGLEKPFQQFNARMVEEASEKKRWFFLAIFFWSLSCWKTNPSSNFIFTTYSSKFSFVILIYKSAFVFRDTSTKFLIPCQEKQRQTINDHPPKLTVLTVMSFAKNCARSPTYSFLETFNNKVSCVSREDIVGFTFISFTINALSLALVAAMTLYILYFTSNSAFSPYFSYCTEIRYVDAICLTLSPALWPSTTNFRIWSPFSRRGGIFP